MTYFNIGFQVCDQIGFLRVMYIIKVFLNIARFVIPIVVIVMTMKDLFSNVLNPNDKDGVHKIIMRMVAAIIVFLVPTLISLVLSLIDYVFDNGADTDYKTSNCYENANKKCISNINSYLKCEDVLNNEYSDCMAYRSCNDYKLSGSCSVVTEVNENCKSINEKYGTKYFASGYKKEE